MSRVVEWALGLAIGAGIAALFVYLGESLGTSLLAGLAFAACWAITGAWMRRRGKA